MAEAVNRGPWQRTSGGMEIPGIVRAPIGEASIATQAALIVPYQSRDLLLAQEGAFRTYLLEDDMTAASLMFGKTDSGSPFLS